VCTNCRTAKALDSFDGQSLKSLKIAKTVEVSEENESIPSLGPLESPEPGSDATNGPSGTNDDWFYKEPELHEPELSVPTFLDDRAHFAGWQDELAKGFRPPLSFSWNDSRFRRFLYRLRSRRLEKRDRIQYAHGFATWLPTPLTESQTSAVVSYSPETLVIAGAGSGKTTLLLARAKYLVESERAHPTRILALAFNRPAAKEIQQRADAASIPMTALTFHSFGNSILNANGRRGGVAFAESQETERFFGECIGASLASSSHSILMKFFSEMLIPVKDQSQFTTLNDYAAYTKAIPRTFSNMRVKSHGELVIANYLFSRGVDFEYESFYQEGERTAWHRPDFTIKVDDQKYYVEYFGVDKELNTAPFVPRENYLREMGLKRQTHITNNTVLIELTYQDLLDGNLVDKLESKLDVLKVPQHWRSAEEMTTAANEAGYTTRFNKLCNSFLSHTRARRMTALRLGSIKVKDRRDMAFIEIFSGYLGKYERVLQELGLPDYSAMINEATELLASHQVPFHYDFVLVDEYQDISADRQLLLESMKIANPHVHFMYVGDDWQSINRFAGSDISIMKKTSHVSPLHKTVRLEETHRFPQSLVDISAEFIQRNPDQLTKQITSTVSSTSKQVLFLHTSTRSGCHAENLRIAIDSIGPANDGRHSLLVIARYNSNLPDGRTVSEMWKGPFDIKSIHKAKGSEADFVVVMDVAQDFRGFPSTIEDDPILQLVMPESEEFEYAEERRLMYVALTRARIACHLIAPISEPSNFLRELLQHPNSTTTGALEVDTVNCPVCFTGYLSTSPVDFGTHCSNSPYCDFRSQRCPECSTRLHVTSIHPIVFSCANHPDKIFSTCVEKACGWGIYVERSGPHGKFSTCSNFSITGCRSRGT